MTTLTDQETEELRIAIAESVIGKEQFCDCKYPEKDMCVCMVCRGRLLPPYTTSIDSIREAAMEKFSGDDARKFQEELDALFRGVAIRHEWQLTALDWAIAFARTAKIWRHKV